MNDEEILVKVKSFLGMGTNTSQDETLRELISNVKYDMMDSGVSEDVVESRNAIGTIERGVIDQWNYGAGADFSPMYIKGVVKLRAKKDETPVSGD